MQKSFGPSHTRVLDGECVNHIGLVRGTMFKNELLLHPEVGRARRRGHPLPKDPYIYGRPYPRNDGGVAEAIHKWRYNCPANDEEALLRSEKDYITLNKAAVNRGITTVKDVDAYRAKHDCRKTIAGGKSDGWNRPKPRPIPPGPYGQPARPSTPIGDVLEHRFQKLFNDEIKEREMAKYASQQEMKEKVMPEKGYYETLACKLRQYQEPVAAEPLWQMKRFSKVKPVVSSWRDDCAKELATHWNATDKVARKGLKFRDGNYARAHNWDAKLTYDGRRKGNVNGYF